MFAREGATVIGCNRGAASAEETLAAAKAEGLTMTSVHPCDMTKLEDVQRYIDSVGKQYGRIDVLVNAAAITPHTAKVAEMDYEKEWSTTLAGEVDLVFLACKAAWPYMLASGNASIINFSSVNAFRGSKNVGMAAHCAGKAAVMALTRQLAVEGGTEIRANSISPGLVISKSTALAGATQEGAYRDAILMRVPRKRLGTPEDIAWCAVYLASDEASWVTGADFTVDGGVLAN
jgi:NAD(P)-dependent dehydrogenase (short-subunit alcohol dehydrogenase family)